MRCAEIRASNSRGRAPERERSASGESGGRWRRNTTEGARPACRVPSVLPFSVRISRFLLYVSWIGHPKSALPASFSLLRRRTCRRTGASGRGWSGAMTKASTRTGRWGSRSRAHVDGRKWLPAIGPDGRYRALMLGVYLQLESGGARCSCPSRRPGRKDKYTIGVSVRCLLAQCWTRTSFQLKCATERR